MLFSLFDSKFDTQKIQDTSERFLTGLNKKSGAICAASKVKKLSFEDRFSVFELNFQNVSVSVRII